MSPRMARRSQVRLTLAVRLGAILTLFAGRAKAQRADTLAHDSASGVTTARLRGVVTNQNGKTPVPGADVWMVSLDRRARTDSTGEFRVDGLPPGPLLIEIRHIGFDARRETITLDRGKETTQRFSLTPNAQPLDTVRSLAQEPQYISPSLRGFEQRRHSRQGGQFISDSVLRANENTTLANILGRIPGATITSGPRGSRVLVSTRKGCIGRAFTVCTHPNCYVEIYIDGVMIYNPTMTEKDPSNPALQPPDLARMGLTDFAGIEFYADAASMPIDMHSSTDEGCGSLWLWTREK
jgi:Carboxypeptidase regulatory-like domain